MLVTLMFALMGSPAMAHEEPENCECTCHLDDGAIVENYTTNQGQAYHWVWKDATRFRPARWVRVPGRHPHAHAPAWVWVRAHRVVHDGRVVVSTPGHWAPRPRQARR